MPTLDRITVGLALQPGERVGDHTPPSFDEMRKRIAAGARDSSLIHSCMRQADYLGLNGEDRYVLLAYQSLVMLERQYKLSMDLLSSTPGAPRVFDPTFIPEPIKGAKT